MRSRRLWALTLALSLGLGCWRSAPADRSPDDVDVALAARIGKALRADPTPDAVRAVLAKEGLTSDEFEAVMYRIAKDPDQSQKYQSLVR